MTWHREFVHYKETAYPPGEFRVRTLATIVEITWHHGRRGRWKTDLAIDARKRTREWAREHTERR